MKHLLWGACAVALISVGACGGGSKPPPTEPMPKKSACAAAAENVAALVIKAKVEDMTEAQRPDIIRILTERCEGDAWSAEVIACLTKVSDSEEEIEKCGELLTEEQEDAVEAQLDRELEPSRRKMESDDGDMEGGSGSAPKGAPPPPPPDDPCGGGA
ncbi:MAG TPA: hypothetical protein VM261_31605 [Kofleriaceae bacterium]|nr:hypothetical protein [Kofleriaceae bacterium]